METYELIINHRRKKSEALALAIMCYLLLVGPLLIDLVSNETQKTPIHIQPAPIIPPRAIAAPVKYVQPTKIKTSPALPSTPIPVKQPTPQQAANPKSQSTPAASPSKPETPQQPTATSQQPTPPSAALQKSNQAKQQPAIEKQPQKTPVNQNPAGGASSHKSATISPPEEDRDESQSYGRNRSSRHKWYRETHDAYPQNSENSSSREKRKHFNVAQGFYNHMIQEQAEKNASALSFGGAVDGFEARLFNEKFIVELCRESYMNPLRMNDPLLVAHYIEVEITCSKQRKVVKANFLQPSPNQQINEYLGQLLRTMITPILPSDMKTEVITFPIYIFIEQQYKNNLIWFVPGKKA